MEATIDKKQLVKLIGGLDKFAKAVTDNSLLEKVALQVKQNIFMLTNAGKDYKGNSFKPYSLVTGKVGIVNLTNTGQMMNSLTQKSLSNNAVMLFFMEARDDGKRNSDIARKHINGYGVPVRDFFGVSEKSNSEIVKEYQTAINKAKQIFKGGV
jgi:phage gpG-like protein